MCTCILASENPVKKGSNVLLDLVEAVIQPAIYKAFHSAVFPVGTRAVFPAIPGQTRISRSANTSRVTVFRFEPADTGHAVGDFIIEFLAT